jgi:hypothetical protein
MILRLLCIWLVFYSLMYRASFIILYYHQQMHNYFAINRTPFALLFPLILMLKYLASVAWFFVHILLNQMAVFVFSNFSPMFCIFFLIFMDPCIAI